jgi:4-amino-4-deoxy-L-arabinose transferase-like glycosyltransferase
MHLVKRRAARSLSLLVIVAGIVFAFRRDYLFQLLLIFSPDRSFRAHTAETIAVLPYFMMAAGLLLPALPRILSRIRALLKQYFKGDNRGLVYVLFGLAFLLRFLPLVLLNVEPLGDSVWYEQAGYNIAKGEGYTLAGKATAFWPVGYPLFLGIVYFIFGHSLFVARFWTVILSLYICFLTYRFSKMVLGDAGSLVALLLIATFPSQIFFSSLFFSEVLFSALFLTVIYLTMRLAEREKGAWFWLGVGLLCGGSILVRPVTLLFPVVIFIFLLWIRKQSFKSSLARTALVIFGISLLLVPWTVRNKKVLGHWILVSTNSGYDFWIGNNPEAKGTFTPEVAEILNVIEDEVQRYYLGYREGFSFILNRPDEFLLLIPRKLFYLFLTDTFSFYYLLTSAGISTTGWLAAVGGVSFELYYLLILLLGVVGILLPLRNESRSGMKLIYWVLGYWVFFHIFLFTMDRYHFPIMPLLIVLASKTIWRWVGRDEVNL